MSCSGGSLDSQDTEARQPTSPMAKLSLFWKASLPCVLAGLGSCSKFHPVPLLPALSPIIRLIKHPSEGVAELIALLLFWKIKSNVTKAGFARCYYGMGISNGPYWCKLPSISRVLVSEIFCAQLKVSASVLRFCFCIGCYLATWEMSCFSQQKCSSRNGSLRFGVLDW